MTGSRQVGHLARELKRKKIRYGVVTMCVGGGMGAAGLFDSITYLTKNLILVRGWVTLPSF